jgi:peptide/nickel transport system ATP-binding protein
MLAKAIMGLLPANTWVSSDAVIEFNGQNLLQIPKAQLRRIIGRDIAMVFQDPMNTLNPVMKIGRQVAEVVRYHFSLNRKASWENAVDLLALVGIPMADRRAKQYPHELSGGLRQRVAIAIALACEPFLLIADEPTTALDVTTQAEILDLLARLQQERQMAMILITHDLGIVAGRTHEAAVMYAGKIVEHAPTPALFKRMRMPYTRALLNAIPRVSYPPHTELETIEGQPPDQIKLPPGCRFAKRCWKALPLCEQTEPSLKCANGGSHRFACWYPLNSNEE